MKQIVVCGLVPTTNTLPVTERKWRLPIFVRVHYGDLETAYARLGKEERERGIQTKQIAHM